MAVRKLLVLTACVVVLTACNSTGTEVIEETVRSEDISGQVVDSRTNIPITSALVILTLPEGDRWSLPSSFLVGYTFTDGDGRFRIPADPKTIRELRHSRASITIDAYHPNYTQSVAFIPRKHHAKPVTIEMKKKSELQVSTNTCSYNNEEICKIVRDYLGL